MPESARHTSRRTCRPPTVERALVGNSEVRPVDGIFPTNVHRCAGGDEPRGRGPARHAGRATFRS
jgi:hypothetical protein